MDYQLGKEDLNIIAKALLNDSSIHSERLVAGLTYIGQFISHDIVPPTGKLRKMRHVSPYLNLDSVYGQQDENYLAPDGTFPLRKIRDKKGHVVGYDVPRKKVAEKYVAEIPEIRNSDVAIVCQIHSLLQRLHNTILTSGFAVDPEQAREYTTLLFQMIAIEDFLKPILQPDIFESYFRNGVSLYSAWNKTGIPNFFKFAAFRFGHSMVRPDYTLNRNSLNKSLYQLFISDMKLTPELVVDWDLFFNNDDELPSISAMKIDTKLATAMSAVKPLNNLFQPVDVIRKNLEAGQLLGLSTGTEIYTQLIDHKVPIMLTPIKRFESSSFKNLVLTNGKTLDVSQLPLWPYILLEAEECEGERLGTVGSILVAEVLFNAIANSEYSVFKNGMYDRNSVFKAMEDFGLYFRSKKGIGDFYFKAVLSVLGELQKDGEQQ